MPDQPWRNARPAPHLPELQPRLRQYLMPLWLRAWWPALLWAVIIFVMSTDSFSTEHTGSVLQRILYWMYPSLTAGQFEIIHHLVRKTAHFTEYFIFSLLVYRGVRGVRTGWRWSWGVTAAFMAAAYSALDEVHQAFVASRHATPYDSMIDSSGACIAMVALWLWFRSRQRQAAISRERA